MLQNYLKIALRNLLRNKVYSFINIAGLALGIFGSIVIFQLVKYHLSTDAFHHNSKQIYRVVMDLHLEDGKIEKEKGSPFILHKTLKNDFPSVENVAYLGQQDLTFSITKANGTTDKYLEKEAAAFTNAQYFKLFDYQWLVGNATLLNTPNSVVLTEKYAKKYFGDVNPINKILRVNNLQNLKVVGLIKNQAENTDLKTEIFISLPTIKTVIPDYGYDDWYWFAKTRETYISLRENTTKASLEAQLPAFSKKYFGPDAKIFQFHLQVLSDVHFNLDYGGKIKQSTLLFLTIIGILLVIIACINFINLSTAQSFKKFKEIGIRKALGSSQRQLFWQFMAETALIVFISVSLAMFIAYSSIPTMNDWLKTEITFNQFFDTKLLILMPLLMISIIFLAGFYPSLIVSNFNPVKALKGITYGINQGISIRKGLVVTQFCVSFVLIAVSILVVLQINFMENKDIGSDKNLVLHVKIPYSENNFWSSLKNQILQKSFVKNVSFSKAAPSSEIGNGGQVKYENRADFEKFAVRSKIADENYVDTYELKLLSGRKPIASDTIREILVNKKLVADLGLKTPEDALNRHLLIGDGGKTGTIVGVLADFNNTDLRTGIEPTVVFSSRNRYRQASIKLNAFDAQNTIQELRKIWERTFPNEVFEYSFYDQELALFYEKEDLICSLSISFALLSILISCLGLFGLANFTAQQRTKEIGIRKVLGASVSQIVGLLSKDFLILVSISIIIASPIAYYFMQEWLQDFAFRIEISWWIFALAGAVALLIALLTVSYQAIKAAVANPVKSLRTE